MKRDEAGQGCNQRDWRSIHKIYSSQQAGCRDRCRTGREGGCQAGARRGKAGYLSFGRDCSASWARQRSRNVGPLALHPASRGVLKFSLSVVHVRPSRAESCSGKTAGSRTVCVRARKRREEPARCARQGQWIYAALRLLRVGRSRSAGQTRR